MAQSTPGTQSVPGQTPQTGAATGGAEEPAPTHPAHLQQLLDRFPDCAVPQWRFADGIATAVVPAAQIVEVVSWLRDQSNPHFDLFVDLLGNHWPERDLPFEVAYIFHSLETNLRIRLKCYAGGEAPTLPSLTSVWPCADWPEREVYDLFGVTFEGHPDLRRIVLPNDWEGYPLRKDFPLGEEPVEFYLPPKEPTPASPTGGELHPDTP